MKKKLRKFLNIDSEIVNVILQKLQIICPEIKPIFNESSLIHFNHLQFLQTMFFLPF